ncbi:MAG: endonuclease/exonuclease/phosphatase family protein [Deltaproteobacteria bacterium]|nr:endonuclease/exonuclease/phosphatase family protein [Deltaproteobacteria bacterium]
MDLRLATFNLENLGLRPDEDTEAVRAWLPVHLTALRAMLRRLDADAVAFQELLDPSLLPALVEGLGYPHIAVADDGGPSPLRIGVLSRYPLRDPAAVATRADLRAADRKSGLTIRVQGAFSRPVLEVRWCLPGLEIYLVVLHWKSKIPSPIGSESGEARWESLAQVGEGRLVSEIKRLAQAVEVRRVVDRHLTENPDACLAVLGDFNDTLDSEGVRIVRGDARSAGAPRLTSQELVPCELAIPRDLRFTHIFRGHREMLDHIFLSRGLMPRFVSARVLNEDLNEAAEGPLPAAEADRGWAPDPFVCGSDHAPFVVTLKL